MTALWSDYVFRFCAVCGFRTWHSGGYCLRCAGAYED